MNKGKLLGVLVAAAGVVASFGSAFALYTKNVADVSLDIGKAAGYAATGTVNYTINGDTGEDIEIEPVMKDTSDENYPDDPVAKKFDLEHKALVYNFELGAQYGEDVVAQDYVAGNLSVTLEDVNANLLNKIKVSMWLDGYKYYQDGDKTVASYGAATYGGQFKSGGVDINNTVITASTLTVDAKDIVVRTANADKQTFHVYLELLDDNLLMDMNEATDLWDLSVSWGQPSVGFERAYVGNTKALWQDSDDFVMAPNIDARESEGRQWTATIVGDAQLTEAKCHRGDTWETQEPNHPVENGHTYKIYWFEGGVAEFYDPSTSA